MTIMTYMLYMVHIFACIWIYIGDKTSYLLENESPWMIKYASTLDRDDKYQMYVFALYWVFTIIATVGYGDYTGGTRIEYCISMVYEFLGILFVSFWMFCINSIANSENNFKNF